VERTHPEAALQLAHFADPTDAGRLVAEEIAELMRERSARREGVLLGLATGRTPVAIYAELVRLHRTEGLDFARVSTVNLDEYLGLPHGDPRSFRVWMERHLFAHVNLDNVNILFPAGSLAEGEIESHAHALERAIAERGGIDLQVLGIGRNGHIGFNEPGSPRSSRTRRVALHAWTREDAAREFGALERVPREALTLGVATILEARRLRLLAFGPTKRDIVRRTLEGPISEDCPASFAREHADAKLYLDLAP
jgi:glucosamine-6-phosphate deaminase